MKALIMFFPKCHHLGLLSLAACLFAAPAARAGGGDGISASFTLVFSAYYDFVIPGGNPDYYASPSLNISPASGATNLVESPDGRTYAVVQPGQTYSGSSSSAGYSTVAAMVSAFTNGQWMLVLNENTSTQQVFHFNVSIPGLTTSLLAPVNFLVPTANATNVPTDTPFQWSGGPPHFSSISVEAYELPSYTLDGYTNLPGTATNWPSPPALPSGTTNYLFITYDSNNFPGATFTIPTNSNLSVLSSWNAVADLASASYMQFSVGTGVVSSCPAITMAPLAVTAVALGSNYDQSIIASGGAAPYDYAVTSGALPGGLSLSAGGVLSGTATNLGVFSFTVTATDTNACTGTSTYSLGVSSNNPYFDPNFFVLHNFTSAYHTNSSGSYTNGDGGDPNGILLYSAGGLFVGGTLFGTAGQSGNFGYGTVFALSMDGSVFGTLHSFADASDGGFPYAGLVSSSAGVLYGAADTGNYPLNGTVFALNYNGGPPITNLHVFPPNSGYPNYTNSDGANPDSGLLLAGNTLYGTTLNDGLYGGGAVYRVNIDGTGFTNLHSFAKLVYTDTYLQTNSDGGFPSSVLVLSGNTLYGTTFFGTTNGNGAVFAVNVDSTGFTNLHVFSANSNPPYTNTDGGNPRAGLVLSGGILYGVADQGGNADSGTVFSMNTNGTGFKSLHSFAAYTPAGTNAQGYYTNSDGTFPGANLILWGNTLYGAAEGGSSGNGTVFAINTDGTGFTNLHFFTAGIGSDLNVTNSDGAFPQSLTLVGNSLYGTTSGGGSGGNGVVFRLLLQPQLATMRSGTNFIVTWPTNWAGFTLQASTNLGSLAVWVTNSPPPVVVNGQNIATNPISGNQKFFRLSQ
jgi:uncharacterized repeat protein (TIGR03803 family)